jgi:hypothetical protein
VHPGEIILRWPDIGAFRICAGKSIEAWSYAGVEERVLRLFTTGSVFAALLHQRGLAVLHGSVVNIGGQAVAFLGPKGAGKSSMAMALHHMGCPLLSDDLLAVQLDAEPLALPGFSQTKLWPDSLANLGYQPDYYARLRPELEKRGVKVDTLANSKALPLRHIFILQESDEIAIVPLNEREALFALLPHWYMARFGTSLVSSMQALSTQFAHCVVLARTAKVSRLMRPHAFAELPRVAQMVQDYVAVSGRQMTSVPATPNGAWELGPVAGIPAVL